MNENHKVVILGSASDIHVVKWANQLSKNNMEIFLISCKDHGEKINSILDKVNKIILPFKSGIGYYLNAPFLNKIINRIAPNSVNVHYASGYGTLGRVSKISNGILSVWGSDVYDFPKKSIFHYKLIKKNLNYYQKVASTSMSMANHVKSYFDYKRDVSITYFGVDLNLFKPKEKYNYGSEINIGIVKKLEPKYGVEYLLKAISILVNDDELKRFKIKLEIIGSGSQRDILENKVHELRIDKYVRFLGEIKNTDIRNTMINWDIFALSSVLDSESFGVVAVEAMAVGLPVVATDVSGFKEVILDNQTGLIVKRKSAEEIYKSIKTLIINPRKREELGLNGVKRVRNKFNIDDNISTMINILNKYTLS